MAVATADLQMTSQQHEIFLRAERRLMAPCCYMQTIDLHMSEIAQTMRQEVAAMVLQGQTDLRIWEHYKAIYGEQILAVPDGALGTAAFAIPVTVAGLATSALCFFLYRFHQRKIGLAHLATHASSAVSTSLPEKLCDEKNEILKQIRAETRW